MAQLADLTKESLLMGDIKNLLEIYEETAAEQCRLFREKILSTRDFLEQLAVLSVAVGADLENLTVKKSKTAAVFLSASEGMYGNLISLVFSEFLKTAKTAADNKTDLVVIGALGRQLMQELAPQLKYQYLDMDEDFKPLLMGYGRLKVFYAKFKNVAVQQAAGSELSGQMVQELIRQSGGKQPPLKFIYEPSLPEIAEKFNREIFHNLLAGMMEEHRLAKQAARLMQLDEAVDDLDVRLAGFKHLTRQELKKAEDKKQQSRMVRFIQ